jgi:hypothetical protein
MPTPTAVEIAPPDAERARLEAWPHRDPGMGDPRHRRADRAPLREDLDDPRETRPRRRPSAGIRPRHELQVLQHRLHPSRAGSSTGSPATRGGMRSHDASSARGPDRHGAPRPGAPGRCQTRPRMPTLRSTAKKSRSDRRRSLGRRGRRRRCARHHRRGPRPLPRCATQGPAVPPPRHATADAGLRPGYDSPLCDHGDQGQHRQSVGILRTGRHRVRHPTGWPWTAGGQPGRGRAPHPLRLTSGSGAEVRRGPAVQPQLPQASFPYVHPAAVAHGAAAPSLWRRESRQRAS